MFDLSTLPPAPPGYVPVLELFATSSELEHLVLLGEPIVLTNPQSVSLGVTAFKKNREVHGVVVVRSKLDPDTGSYESIEEFHLHALEGQEETLEPVPSPKHQADNWQTSLYEENIEAKNKGACPEVFELKSKVYNLVTGDGRQLVTEVDAPDTTQAQLVNESEPVELEIRVYRVTASEKVCQVSGLPTEGDSGRPEGTFTASIPGLGFDPDEIDREPDAPEPIGVVLAASAIGWQK